MSFAKLRPQIGTLLGTVTGIQEVSNSPKIKFSGYPAAHIVPSDNESAYETTTENVRVYAFSVRLFYETKHSGIETAMAALESIVDEVLDKIDQEDLKGSASRTIGKNLPTGYTFLNILAVPGAWGELEQENLIMTQLTVKVRVSIDIT